MIELFLSLLPRAFDGLSTPHGTITVRSLLCLLAILVGAACCCLWYAATCLGYYVGFYICISFVIQGSLMLPAVASNSALCQVAVAICFLEHTITNLIQIKLLLKNK